MVSVFDIEYKKLNKAQKEAVDSTEGPVMVVAGPGTGKTQILALRIGNILKLAGVSPDSILCLTFTNAGVSAMKERLHRYIGPDASKVNIYTFHKFALDTVSNYYSLLDFDTPPKLLEDTEAVALCDGILHQNDWKYLKPRSDNTKYFRDLKSLVSFLKRERITPDDLNKQVRDEINFLKQDPGSLSSRGDTKGELKKEVIKKIEGLERTMEAVEFYRIYEEEKFKNGLLDYDDVLDNLVRLVSEYEDVASDIREKYLYVLIDEHQDSSGVQNDFLKKVWSQVEQPNIFVVGDDRQLIYGFGGASIAYFEEFKDVFGDAKLITLVENYRSTTPILEASHALLESSVTKEKLRSQSEENHPLKLVEAEYPRDEILAFGIEVKKKIEAGENPGDIALLVPKNFQARNAITILEDMGIPVSGGDALNLFDTKEAISMIRVLKIISNPYDTVSLSESLFDQFSGISPLEAHKFAYENDLKKISLEKTNPSDSLFGDKNSIERWLGMLRNWIQYSGKDNVYSLLQRVGKEFLLDTAEDHENLIRRVEVLRTLLNLALSKMNKDPKLNIREFSEFLERLESYKEHIPLSVFSRENGVRVMTLHASKGLEFDFVWIAHMDEKSLMKGKQNAFSLPEKVADRVHKKDIETAKRELYVAITRAKRFCNISYPLFSDSGVEQELASIILDLPTGIFDKQNASDTGKKILDFDPKAFVEKNTLPRSTTGISELRRTVSEIYAERQVSVSMLNNFFECPWKWYFRSLLKLPEEKSNSLDFGDRVHKGIDFILKLDKDIDEHTLWEVVHKDKEVFKVVLGWVKKRLGEISKKRENEQSVSLKDKNFPHLNFYGKIDLIEKLDAENVRVTDFKTGSVKKKSDIEKIDEEGRLSNLMRQLAMYSYLLKNSPKWRGVDVRESRLEFLEAVNSKEATYEKVIGDSEINALLRDIEDYDNLLKSGEWVNRECHYNSYGKNTKCEYCQMAQIYK